MNVGINDCLLALAFQADVRQAGESLSQSPNRTPCKDPDKLRQLVEHLPTNGLTKQPPSLTKSIHFAPLPALQAAMACL